MARKDFAIDMPLGHWFPALGWMTALRLSSLPPVVGIGAAIFSSNLRRSPNESH